MMYYMADVIACFFLNGLVKKFTAFSEWNPPIQVDPKLDLYFPVKLRTCMYVDPK